MGKAAVCLKELVLSDPQWPLRVMREGVPDPSADQFDEALPKLIETIGRLYLVPDVDGAALRGVPSLLVTLIEFRQQFAATRKTFFGTAAARQDPRVTMWRLCTFVESQARLLGERLRETATAGGAFDPLLANSSFIVDPAGNRIDAVAQNDGLVEAAELAIRLMIRQPVTAMEIDYALIPSGYEDPDFQVFLTMAGRWHWLRDCWDRIKYADWALSTPKVADGHSGERRVTAVYPRNEQEFFRREATYRRANVHQTQEAMPQLLMGDFSDSPQRCAALAAAIRPPAEVGGTWPMDVPPDLLAAVIANSRFAWLTDDMAERYYYRDWINDIDAARRPADPTWATYHRVRIALKHLADAIGQVTVLHPRTGHHDDAMGVARVRLNDLINLLAPATGCTPDEVRAVLRHLTFDPNRRQMEWWDQPLLAFDDVVWICPSVVSTGDPLRTVENQIAARSTSVSQRSRTFEASITEFLKTFPGCRAVQGVKFIASDGREIEYDVVAFWQNTLILLELKCLRSVTSPYEEYRASLEVDNAIEQLNRRHRIALADWQTLRDLTPLLDLPEKADMLAGVTRIAVINVMAQSARSEQGVVVTDALCFRKFFDTEPVNYAYTVGKNSISRTAHSRNRDRDDPAASDMTEYFSNPPQLAWIVKALEKQWLWCPPADGCSPIACAGTTFTGIFVPNGNEA